MRLYFIKFYLQPNGQIQALHGVDVPDRWGFHYQKAALSCSNVKWNPYLLEAFYSSHHKQPEQDLSQEKCHNSSMQHNQPLPHCCWHLALWPHTGRKQTGCVLPLIALLGRLSTIYCLVISLGSFCCCFNEKYSLGLKCMDVINKTVSVRRCFKGIVWVVWSEVVWGAYPQSVYYLQ